MSVMSNLSDSGVGSLRQAMLDSNTNGSNITTTLTSGTVPLGSDLPTKTNSYDITLHSGITIDSSGYSSGNGVLRISATGTIRYLVMDHGNRTDNRFISVTASVAVTFLDCEFYNNTLSLTSPAFVYQTGGSDVTLERCTATDVYYATSHIKSFQLTDTFALNKLTIKDCTFTNVGQMSWKRAGITIQDTVWTNSGITTTDAILTTSDTVGYSGTFFLAEFSTFTGLKGTAGAIRMSQFFGSTTIRNCEFDSCESTGGTGHASTIWCEKVSEGIHLIDGCYIHDSTSVGWQGACVFESDALSIPVSLTIKNSSFVDNGSLTGGLDGGAIDFKTWKQSSGNIEVINCTFDSNLTERWGGACRCNIGIGNADIYFINCTFRNNQTNTTDQGGAINHGSGTIYLRNCLFEGNKANAVLNTLEGSSAYDADYCLMDNAGGSGLTDDPPNHIWVGTGYTFGLTAVADNGGKVETCAIAFNSDAKDTGDSTQISETFDARGAGFPRKSGVVDLGAYEYLDSGCYSMII